MSPRLRTADGWGIPSMPPPSLRRNGWGDAQGATRGVQVGSSIASSFAPVAITSAANASIAAGGSGLILGMSPSLAVPVIGAALVGATILATYLIKNSGCGQTCIQTSQWANQAADALQKNLDAYMALPIPRPREAQQVALQNFDALWGQLKQMCGDPQWGDAGKRCISDREQGACKWKNNGECWNWFIGYRDPIANDPNVGSASTDALDSILGNDSGGSLLPLLAIGGLVLAAVAL